MTEPNKIYITEAKYNEIIELYKQYSVNKIEKLTGISDQSINKILNSKDWASYSKSKPYYHAKKHNMTKKPSYKVNTTIVAMDIVDELATIWKIRKRKFRKNATQATYITKELIDILVNKVKKEIENEKV